MDPRDMELAKKVDCGEITPTELVARILEEEIPWHISGEDELDFDCDQVARRIVNALQY